jgi:hypothetical protein
MCTPPLRLNTVTVASAAAGVALVTLAVAIATLQLAVAASRERVMGAVIAAGAPTDTATGTITTARHHPLTALPSSQLARAPLL